LNLGWRLYPRSCREPREFKGKETSWEDRLIIEELVRIDREDI
jgi:hypothetical protein